MATFTPEELTTRQIIGAAAAVLLSIAAIGCHIALVRGAGVPEFLITARGLCWAGVIVAVLWAGLASFLKEFKNS